jgi:hypothetical protein
MDFMKRSDDNIMGVFEASRYLSDFDILWDNKERTAS